MFAVKICFECFDQTYFIKVFGNFCVKRCKVTTKRICLKHI